MKRIALACTLSLVATQAWAQKAEDEEEEEEEEDEDEDAEAPAPAPEPKQASKGKASDKDEFKKQDLRGHSVDADEISNPFQKDRFFVDKVDTEKTEKGTLVQGSLQLSSFLYRESAGNLPNGQGSAAGPGRLFGDLRSQTDFRHIGGSRWDGRFDLRGRYVTDPASASLQSSDPNRIQSGFNGTNELEVREAWFVRSGKRTDLFFGRQFVPDLGAIKIDGLRFDYAASEKMTYLGFAGFYPLRGSRSITTDYPKLRTSDGTDDLTSAGKLVTAGGFGTAYRTINMHGALGGVAIVPLSSERPRIYATSNGYYRAGTQVDFYHYAILDVFGAAADPVALTNLSAGVNYKPGQRLRLTASFNRVDTETLNVQAGSFLDATTVTDATAGSGATKVQNETFIQLQRISTNSARASLSVGLGSLNRVEITIASAFRYRPGITLRPGSGDPIELDPGKAIDVFGSIMDRRSLFDLRIGVDASRSIAVGDVSFNRAESLTVRGFASREIGKGRGEWEAEVSYATSRDRSGEMTIACTGSDISPASCFGASNTSVLSVGGQVYYRVKQDVFAIGNLYVSQMSLERKDADMTVDDPKITGITAFARIAYRF